MSIIDTLITDRTIADVEDVVQMYALGTELYLPENAAILEKFLQANLKGTYNYTDLNRVNEAMTYLDGILNYFGYSTNYSEQKIIWEEESVPNESQMELYLKNVRALRSVFPVPDGTPYPPDSMTFLKVDGANNIEKILKILNELLENMQHAFQHCGAPFSICGLDGGLIT